MKITRTLKDTVVNASGAGGTVTVLVNWDDENSSNNVLCLDYANEANTLKKFGASKCCR